MPCGCLVHVYGGYIAHDTLTLPLRCVTIAISNHDTSPATMAADRTRGKWGVVKQDTYRWVLCRETRH